MRHGNLNPASDLLFENLQKDTVFESNWLRARRADMRLGVTMSRRQSVLFFLAIPAGLYSQTKLDLQNQSRSVDFSAAPATKPAKVVTSIPAACGAGEFAFLSNATPGQNLYLCVTSNTWAQVSGSGTRSAVSATPSVITMAPGAVWASGVQSLYGSAATVTRNSGTDTGLFTIGYNAAGQRVCYYGSGINIANYSVAGFAGATCVFQAPSSGIFTAATVAIGGGAFQTPIDFRADAVVASLTCGTNLTPVAGGGCGVDPSSTLAWTGRVDFGAATRTTPVRSGSANPATCTAGELFVNTSLGPGLEFCSSTNVWTAIH
jgi:hypothetical protein